MTDARLAKFRKTLDHVGVQQRTAHHGIRLADRDASTEEDALPVRRGAVVERDLARVADDAVAGHQSPHLRGGQGLRGNDVAADRDHAAREPRRESARTAVRIGQGGPCLEGYPRAGCAVVTTTRSPRITWLDTGNRQAV
jgi:hypothetical protein